MQNIVQEDKKLVQEQVNKCNAPFTFCLKIRNWEDNMADEAYVLLALCRPLEMSATHKRVLLQQELPEVHSFLSCNPSPWKAVTHQKIWHFIDKLALHEYEGPAKIFWTYPTILLPQSHNSSHRVSEAKCPPEPNHLQLLHGVDSTSSEPSTQLTAALLLKYERFKPQHSCWWPCLFLL